MASRFDLRGTILNAWRTNHQITIFLIERVPLEVWEAKIPGASRRTVWMLAAHIHNVRCRWIRALGREHGLASPASVDRFRVNAKELVSALQRSSRGVVRLLELGCDQGGSVPDSVGYVWRNLPLDVGHVLSYFVAHEGHHRGQIVMLARELDHRLPVEVTEGLWQWSRLSKKS